MQGYNDHASESSESDIEDDHLYKATTAYGKIAKVAQKAPYSSSDESDESPPSDDEAEEEAPHQKGRKGQERAGMAYQHASDSEDSEEEENSIDHIEERIKRLEMDLQKKIDKHKKESVPPLKDRPTTALQRGSKNLKIAASPPLPKKLEAKSPAVGKPHPEIRIHKNPKEEKEEERVEHEEYLPPTKKQFKAVEHPNPQQAQREPKEVSPKKKLSKQKKEEEVKNPSLLVDKKRTESKGNTKPDHSHSHQQAEANIMKKLNKATKQIQQLAKELQQTRKQNKRLKEQLSSSKKKKSLEEVQKLKELAADSADSKLQKEIQLLKIIEGLQAKLKKSINKKLGKSRAGSTSAALLHKGLPSNLMH